MTVALLLFGKCRLVRYAHKVVTLQSGLTEGIESSSRSNDDSDLPFERAGRDGPDTLTASCLLVTAAARFPASSIQRLQDNVPNSCWNQRRDDLTSQCRHEDD